MKLIAPALLALALLGCGGGGGEAIQTTSATTAETPAAAAPTEPAATPATPATPAPPARPSETPPAQETAQTGGSSTTSQEAAQDPVTLPPAPTPQAAARASAGAYIKAWADWSGEYLLRQTGGGEHATVEFIPGPLATWIKVRATTGFSVDVYLKTAGEYLVGYSEGSVLDPGPYLLPNDRPALPQPFTPSARYSYNFVDKLFCVSGTFWQLCSDDETGAWTLATTQGQHGMPTLYKN